MGTIAKLPLPVPVLKTPAQIRALFQCHTEDALNALVELVHGPNQTLRYHAATAILDRANGKPVQQMAIEQVSQEDKDERKILDWLARHEPMVLQRIVGLESLPLRPKRLPEGEAACEVAVPAVSLATDTGPGGAEGSTSAVDGLDPTPERNHS